MRGKRKTRIHRSWHIYAGWSLMNPIRVQNVYSSVLMALRRPMSANLMASNRYICQHLGAMNRDFVSTRHFYFSRVRKEIIASLVGLGNINACYGGSLSRSISVFCEYLYCSFISANSCVEVFSEAVASRTGNIVLAFCYVAGRWI
jgi:hypothetical protein